MTQDQRRKRKTVGWGDEREWGRLHAVAVGAVAIGVIAVVGVLASAMVGDDSNAATIQVAPPGAASQDAPASTVTTQATTDAATPSPSSEPTEDEPFVVACGDILAPLDKEHTLPADCAPGDLRDLPQEIAHGGVQRMRAEAATALIDLAQAAKRDGYNLVAISAYRSYADQVAAYESNVQQFGKEYADRTSARPGRSEHQLGTTVDVSSASASYGLESFEDTPEARWIAENSWKFGFIVSYPEGKEPLTGYAYEPWHIRYVGRDTAAAVRQSGLTLHEYLLR